MQRLLHLQHHHHTGKRLAHKHTSYRGLFVLVALFGVALIGIHQSVKADDIVATAKVAAPTPAAAAEITSHTDGDILDQSAITLSGSCSFVDPATVVEIYVDGQFASSTSCTSSDTFTLPFTLTAGRHQFIAKTVNITDDYGPDSTPIYLTYRIPATPTPAAPTSPVTAGGAGQNTPEQTSGDGLRIYSKYTYLLYGPEKDAEWAGYFEGGTPPYKVSIDWGDGTSSNYTASDSSAQTYRHTYSRYEPFFVTVQVSDTAGYSLTMQIAAVTPFVSNTGTPPFIVGEELARVDQIVLYVGYGTVVTLLLLGILTIYHAEYPYLRPRTVAKQYAHTKNVPRKRR